MGSFNLQRQATDFAGRLTDLLNSTVCNGVRLTTVIRPDDSAVVGYRITKVSQVAEIGIPVTISAKPPSCYITLSYRLEPDDERAHIAVTSSFIGLSLADDFERRPLLHYDYERHKPDGYPEAHLQVYAQSDHWLAACNHLGDRPLAKLHLPVGGRRYRPTLEDVVEFLVVERLSNARADCLSSIEKSREDFQRRQLKAAVRRDPDAAEEALVEFRARRQ